MPLQYPAVFRALLASATLLLAAPVASWAADSPAATAKPAAKPASAGAKPAARPAAKPASSAQAAAAPLTEGQLSAADRVLTGTADCEFKQRVVVHKHPDHAGHFHVEFKGVRYTMVPEETQTGAVRLFDNKAGVVWLQIPAKSMLMNAKIGQRMVDGCTQDAQRVALAAAPAASGSGIGIVPAAPAAAPAVVASPALAAVPATAASR